MESNFNIESNCHFLCPSSILPCIANRQYQVRKCRHDGCSVSTPDVGIQSYQFFKDLPLQEQLIDDVFAEAIFAKHLHCKRFELVSEYFQLFSCCLEEKVCALTITGISSEKNQYAKS